MRLSAVISFPSQASVQKKLPQSVQLFRYYIGLWQTQTKRLGDRRRRWHSVARVKHVVMHYVSCETPVTFLNSDQLAYALAYLRPLTVRHIQCKPKKRIHKRNHTFSFFSFSWTTSRQIDANVTRKLKKMIFFSDSSEPSESAVKRNSSSTYGGYGKFFSCMSIFRADETLPSSPMMLKSTARCIARNPSEKYPIRTQKRLEFEQMKTPFGGRVSASCGSKRPRGSKSTMERDNLGRFSSPLKILRLSSVHRHNQWGVRGKAHDFEAEQTVHRNLSRFKIVSTRLLVFML